MLSIHDQLVRGKPLRGAEPAHRDALFLGLAHLEVVGGHEVARPPVHDAGVGGPEARHGAGLENLRAQAGHAAPQQEHPPGLGVFQQA